MKTIAAVEAGGDSRGLERNRGRRGSQSRDKMNGTWGCWRSAVRTREELRRNPVLVTMKVTQTSVIPRQEGDRFGAEVSSALAS